jgi:hypothetical protein
MNMWFSIKAKSVGLLRDGFYQVWPNSQALNGGGMEGIIKGQRNSVRRTICGEKAWKFRCKIICGLYIFVV